jgi:Rod binding domain-containing protein
MNSVTSATIHNLSPDARRATLRQAANELVGGLMFGTMLKMARNVPFRSEFGHGGRGEDMFGSLLDQELAVRASKKMDTGLTEAIVKKFEGTVERGQ